MRLRLRLAAVSLFAVLSVAGLAFADTPAPAAKWELFDEEDGVRCFRRDVAGTDIVALRGEGFVPAPITRVASVLVNRGRAHEWIDRLARTKTLRQISERLLNLGQ